MERLPRVLPSLFVLNLDLFPGRVCRDFNAEQVQARERAGHGLRVFPLHDMQLDLEMISGRLVDFRGPSLQ